MGVSFLLLFRGHGLYRSFDSGDGCDVFLLEVAGEIVIESLRGCRQKLN
jgi:hypothetical protein